MRHYYAMIGLMKIRRARLHKRIPKSVVWSLAGTVVLLVLLVGAGLGYTWYMGKHAVKDATTVEEPVATPKAPVIKPSKPSPDAAVGVAIHALTTPVMPGDNSSVTIQTTPEVRCDIVVEYNKVASKDSGLVSKYSDEYGVASWSWTVDDTAPVGKWPVKITCTSAKEKSGVVQGDLEVVNHY
jgi:hypothetical protein